MIGRILQFGFGGGATGLTLSQFVATGNYWLLVAAILGLISGIASLYRDAKFYRDARRT